MTSAKKNERTSKIKKSWSKIDPPTLKSALVLIFWKLASTIKKIKTAPRNLHIDLENSTLKSAYESFKIILIKKKIFTELKRKTSWSNCRIIFGGAHFYFLDEIKKRSIFYYIRLFDRGCFSSFYFSLINKSEPWYWKMPQPQNFTSIKVT